MAGTYVDNITTIKPADVKGAVWVGDSSSTIPTDVSSALTGFKKVGYISEDGVTKSEDRESEDIKEWGGTVVGTTQTGYTATYQFTMISATNEAALKAYYGDDNVTISDDGAITITGSTGELPERPWVIDTVLTDGRKCREVIPRGKISETGDITYKRDEAMGYDVTITALPDDTAAARPYYIYYSAPSA